MHLFKMGFIVISSLSLSACSLIYGEDGLIKDTTYDYLKAEKTKDLKLPEGTKQKNKVDYTQIPAIGKQAESAPIGKNLLANTPVQILDVLENVRLDKVSVDPAVFIQEDKDFLWQSILTMFNDNEITPKIANQAQYEIKTGWLAVDPRGLWLGIENSEEIDEFKAQYSISLKPGALNGEVQLVVKRTHAERYNDDLEKWQPVATYWHESAQMLNFILADYDGRVVEREKKQRETLIAGFKIELGVDAENNPALVTSADKELVWSKLPKVLTAAKMEVKDKDRRSMTYFLKYEKEEPGFFASLFSNDSAAITLENGDYQAVVGKLGERTTITLKDGQGESLQAAELNKVFPLLSKLLGERR
jgi:outer membrane protein assembly factor BamC